MKTLAQYKKLLDEGEVEVQTEVGNWKTAHAKLQSEYIDLAKNQIFGKPAASIQPQEKKEPTPQEIADKLGLKGLDL